MGLKNEKCVNNNLFVLLNKLSSIYFGNQFRYKYSFIVILSENKNKQIIDRIERSLSIHVLAKEGQN